MRKKVKIYAAVNGHLELLLLKDRQRFDAVSTSNLEIYKFRDGRILTYFIFGHGESSLNNLKHGESWTNVRFIVLLFSLFESETWPRKNKSAWWIFTQLYFRGGESWPNYFGKEVNWWWILTLQFCWKGEQRWRLEVGRFKMPFDACIREKVFCVVNILWILDARYFDCHYFLEACIVSTFNPLYPKWMLTKWKMIKRLAKQKNKIIVYNRN